MICPTCAGEGYFYIEGKPYLCQDCYNVRIAYCCEGTSREHELHNREEKENAI
jgi:hypothetical protein